MAALARNGDASALPALLALAETAEELLRGSIEDAIAAIRARGGC